MTDTKIELRPLVIAFAERMELALRGHDEDRGDCGWAGDDPAALYARIQDEMGELAKVLVSDSEFACFRAITEAVDVANFAMMVASESGLRVIVEARQ